MAIASLELGSNRCNDSNKVDGGYNRDGSSGERSGGSGFRRDG